MAAGLIKLGEIQRALAEAKTLDEFVSIRDQSKAVLEYCKAAKLGVPMVNDAMEFKLRSERGAGAILAKMEKKKNRHSSALKMRELEIDHNQSHRWQRLASLPEKIFDKHLADVRSAEKELTTASVLRLASPKPKSQKQRNLFECLSLMRLVIARLYVKWPEDSRIAMAEQLRNLADQIEAGTLFTEDQDEYGRNRTEGAVDLESGDGRRDAGDAHSRSKKAG